MKNKNVFLIICFVISILILGFDLLFDNKNEFKLSEVYVSLAAFVMLIGTAILQNIELSMQREDLELTRREMKEQTKEFEENNKQAKFFELLKIKEDIYMNIDRDFLSDFIRDYKRNLMNVLEDRLHQNERLDELTSGFLNDINKYKYDLSLYRENIAEEYNLSRDESIEFEEILAKEFGRAVGDAFGEVTIPKEVKKLQQFNYILDRMYVDNSIAGGLGNILFNIKFGSPKDMNFSEIYKQLKTSEEVELYKILDRKITIEDL